MEPDIIFFDEATSSLDPELVGEFITTMKDLTMVLVRHKMGFAEEIADKMCIFIVKIY